MSKKEDIQRVSEGLISGFIAPQQDNIIEEPKESHTEPKTTKKEQLHIKVNINDLKAKNGANKNDNYTITFKIDADIEDYLKLIDKITFIESAKSGKIESITRTEFVNKLIREQFYNLIKATSKDTADDINRKWLEYKDKNNL